MLDKVLGSITVNAHSSVRIDCGHLKVYVDPYLLKESPHDADVILLTHDHYDHFSPEDAAKVSHGRTIYVAPNSCEQSLTDFGISYDDIVFMKPGDAIEAAGLEIEAVRAYNPDKQFHPRSNGWLGYVITVDGIRVYVTGDTDSTPETDEVECDIVCVPIGGTYTFDAEEAAAFVNTIKPKIAIPTHYGAIVGKPEDADAFRAAVDKDIRVVEKIAF